MITPRLPLAALGLAFLLASAPASAGITLGVGAGGPSAQAEFGPGITRVFGRATDSTAFVDSGPDACVTSIGCTIVNTNAFTKAHFDAEQMRWRVEGGATGNNSGSSAQLLVTDVLTLAGIPSSIAWLNFSVRVELDELSAYPTTGGIGADAWYGFELGYMVTDEESSDYFQPIFSLTAEEHNYAGFPSQRSFTAPGVSESTIPSSYETTFSIPVFLGPSGQGSYDIAIRSWADTAVQEGTAFVSSFNSAYLGVTATGASFTSANGYGYRGFTSNQVPEPPAQLLALAGLGLMVAARRRRAA